MEKQVSLSLGCSSSKHPAGMGALPHSSASIPGNHGREILTTLHLTQQTQKHKGPEPVGFLGCGSPLALRSLGPEASTSTRWKAGHVPVPARTLCQENKWNPFLLDLWVPWPDDRLMNEDHACGIVAVSKADWSIHPPNVGGCRKRTDWYSWKELYPSSSLRASFWRWGYPG